MKTIKFVALLAILFLVSCASPMQKKLLNGLEPYYSGEVNPITRPIQLKYSPVSLKETTLIVGVVQTPEGSEVMEGQSVFYKKISRLEDSLLWEIETTTPIKNEIKILTDVYGNVKKIDVAKSEQSDFMTSLIKENLYALPQEPVRSGDVYKKIDMGTSLKRILSNAKLLTSEADLKIDSDFRFEQIIRGFGDFEGKNRIIVSTDSYNNKFNFTSTPIFAELLTVITYKNIMLLLPENTGYHATLYYMK